MSIRKAFLAATLTAAALSAGGCAAFAWFVAQFAPPQKVKAQFTPPSGKKILVFVDDPYFKVDYEPLKAELANRINQRLVANKVAAATIPYDRFVDLLAATPDFNRLRVSEVGSRLGADLVLYVQIDQFSLRDDPANPLWHGRLRTSVRLVRSDAPQSEDLRLWPLDRKEGYPVPEQTVPESANTSPTYGAELARLLADGMADRIAKLFYEHTVPVGSEEPSE
ncbi:MAG TPA: hypothetical protein PK082_04470 [Phycisphaerae bacterium]|nr:hypothetical protein [Phycisphaerae bacterium]